MKIKVTASKSGIATQGQDIVLPSIVVELKITPLENLDLDGNNLEQLKRIVENIALNYCVDAGIPVTAELIYMNDDDDGDGNNI